MGYYQSSGPISRLKSAAVSVSSSGDNTIVAAVSGKSIRLVSFYFVAAGAVNVTIKSGASTSLTGAMPIAASGSGLACPPCDPDVGVIQGNQGDALVVNLSGAVALTGWVQYVEAN